MILCVSPLEVRRAISYDFVHGAGGDMTDTEKPGTGQPGGGGKRAAARQERLAAALRQNLSRRKAQSRARETPDRGEPTDPVTRKD